MLRKCSKAFISLSDHSLIFLTAKMNYARAGPCLNEHSICNNWTVLCYAINTSKGL